MQSNDEILVNEWLDECRTPATRNLYSRYIKAFQQWYKKPLAEFLALEPKEMRHTALCFQNEQVSNGSKSNTVRSMITALGSFCSQNGKPLPLRGKRLRLQIDLDSHAFSNGDLSSMFDVANTQEKAILATFTSLGWEVSAILKLKRGRMNSLIAKARQDKAEYVYFQDQRQKTGALRLGVLNPLALEWLEKWFKEWQGENVFEYKTKEGINSLLKRLAREAQLSKTGRIHSHSLRKWVMSGLSRAGFNDYQIKFVMGKTIPTSDSTYLLTLAQEIEERYPTAFQHLLNLKPSEITIIETKSKELNARLDALEKENAGLKTRLSEIGNESRINKLEEELLKMRESLQKLLDTKEG